MPAAFASLRLEAGTTLELHNVAPADEPNFYVEDVRTPGRLQDPKRHRIEAIVAGAGTPAANRTIKLMLGSRELGRRTVSLAPRWTRGGSL